MAVTDQAQHNGTMVRVLLGVVIILVAALWFLFLFGNPFAASAEAGVSDGEPIVIEVVDDGPASESLSGEELQQLLDEEGASHDGEALIHTEPGS